MTGVSLSSAQSRENPAATPPLSGAPTMQQPRPQRKVATLASPGDGAAAFRWRESDAKGRVKWGNRPAQPARSKATGPPCKSSCPATQPTQQPRRAARAIMHAMFNRPWKKDYPQTTKHNVVPLWLSCAARRRRDSCMPLRCFRCR